jgi:hypothetical protein
VLDSIELSHPEQNFRLISPLAEGADRLVARQVLARPGSELLVPLPIPREEYLANDKLGDEFRALIARAHEVIELPPAESREASYERAGHYVLDHSDLLLALWNGEAASGRGGTGDIVARARARQHPIAWIFVTNGMTESLPRREAGATVFENWDQLKTIDP